MINAFANHVGSINHYQKLKNELLKKSEKNEFFEYVKLIDVIVTSVANNTVCSDEPIRIYTQSINVTIGRSIEALLSNSTM